MQFTKKLYDLYYNVTSHSPKEAFKLLSDDVKNYVSKELKVCGGQGLFIMEANALMKHLDTLETALEDSVPFIQEGTWTLQPCDS